MGPNTVVSTRPRSWGLSMICYHWGSRSPETACVSAPASRLGGGAPRFWQYDRRREAAVGAAALVSRQWNPPPTSQRIITTWQFEGYTTKQQISSKYQFCAKPANRMHTSTMVVGSTDGNSFRTEGKGITTTITLADGKLLPCIATRV